MPMPTRMTALVISMLYALRRARIVDTSAVGEFDPSLVRKIGSVPAVRMNRACTPRGVMVQPSACTWHDAQLRPLVPRLWKNGPLRSIAPARLKVAAKPASFNAGSRFGNAGCVSLRSPVDAASTDDSMAFDDAVAAAPIGVPSTPLVVPPPHAVSTARHRDERATRRGSRQNNVRARSMSSLRRAAIDERRRCGQRLG